MSSIKKSRKKKRAQLILLPLLFISLLLGHKLTYAEAEGQWLSIAVVKSRNIEPFNRAIISFKESMLKKEGELKIIEFDFESDGDNAGRISNKILSFKPALIVTLGTSATVGLRKTPGLPNVIYAMILNPFNQGIVPPGVAMDMPFEANLRQIKRILPKIKKIGTIYSPGASRSYEELRKASAEQGLQLIGKQIDSQQDFPAALEEIFKSIDCYVMLADPNVYLPKATEYLLLQGLQRKVPVVGLSSSYTKAGALLAFDCDYADLGRQTAELVLKILNNETQALKENVLPRKINFSLNSAVAKRIGIDIPPEIKKQASEVYGE